MEPLQFTEERTTLPDGRVLVRPRLHPDQQLTFGDLMNLRSQVEEAYRQNAPTLLGIVLSGDQYESEQTETHNWQQEGF